MLKVDLIIFFPSWWLAPIPNDSQSRKCSEFQPVSLKHSNSQEPLIQFLEE